MNTAVILTVVGSDRPGLTQAVAKAVTAAGGNWLESHLAKLAGKYVGSILVEVPVESVSILESLVRQIDPDALQVSIVSAGDDGKSSGELILLEIVGQDRVGIVREVTAVLSDLQVNIEDFVTSLENSSWSGCRLFRVRARIALPEDCSSDDVRDAIERISGEIMVDFSVSSLPPQRREPALTLASTEKHDPIVARAKVQSRL